MNTNIFSSQWQGELKDVHRGSNVINLKTAHGKVSD